MPSLVGAELEDEQREKDATHVRCTVNSGAGQSGTKEPVIIYCKRRGCTSPHGRKASFLSDELMH